MIELKEVDVPRQSLERLAAVVDHDRLARLLAAAEPARSVLGGRTVWNVNSTASGGGVAEMLQVLVGYARGVGIDTRWAVIGGDAEFFAITKRIHNFLHGSPGDGGPLGEREAAHYAEVTTKNAELLLERVRPDDVALLHDPQTAGLLAPVREAGATVVWRCHIGVDTPNEYTERGWDFLRPHLSAAQAMVFSRAQYVPGWADHDAVVIIPPSIDPFSPKNQDLERGTVVTILTRTGIITGAEPASPPVFVRGDGSPGEVTRSADILRSGAPPAATVPLVVQISRWDRLKDMLGVMLGFAAHVAPRGGANLVLAGPRSAGVADDPESNQVLDECVAAWRPLPNEGRARIQLVSLPMDDVDENAAIVNALQRHATVIVQKSLAEGFGLTVSEGMWKGRPVVASAVGGIMDQVTPDTGVLLDDPTDLDAFGTTVAGLLDRPEEIARLGANARERVRDRFLADRHLLQYAELFERLLTS
jgi:trehalose synthase